MALADLAVNFKLTGARDAQSQVDRLGSSFTKLGGTVDKASSMVRNSISTMTGMMSSMAMDRIASGVVSATKQLAAIPGRLIEARQGISEARSELLQSGLDKYELDQFEKEAYKISNRIGGITAKAYLAAAYEMQSSIPEATMKTKQKMAEAALLTAQVTSSTSEDMAKLFAKSVHSLRAVNKSEDEIIQRMQAFAGKFKKSVDVGVFRGPDMLEALKETIPVWMQRGASDAEMIGLNTFLMTQGFNASTSGVYSREMAQRLPKAIAAAELASRIYSKSKSEEEVRKSIDNSLKYKADLYKIQSEMDKQGVFTSGPTKMLEAYKSRLEQLPKVLADKLRLKYTHEHLDPGLLAIFGSWDKYRQMISEIEQGNYDTVIDMIKAKNKELSQQTKLLSQQFENFGNTIAKTFEPAWLGFSGILGKELQTTQESLEKHQTVLNGYASGFIGGFKSQLTQSLGTGIGSWMDEMFGDESRFSMFMKGELAGKKFGAEADPWLAKTFKQIGKAADTLSQSLASLTKSMSSVAELILGEGSTGQRLQKYLGDMSGGLGSETQLEKRINARFNPKEGESEEDFRARVIQERQLEAQNYSVTNPLHVASPISLLNDLLVKLGVLAERQPATVQMQGNITAHFPNAPEVKGTFSGQGGKPNTANAMGK